MRLYILGAGFSHGYNEHSYPLMRDFLQAAKRNREYDIQGRHAALAQFIAKYFGYAEYHDIEKVMSFLNAPTLDDPQIPFEHRLQLYDDLIRLIQSTLRASHVIMRNNMNTEFYAAFAQHLIKENSTVISFNYDLLLDALLYDTGQWFGWNGYGADIPPADTAFPLAYRRIIQPPSNPMALTVTLLKMHGSINWGIPTLHGEYDNTIYQDWNGYYPRGCPGITGTGPMPIGESSIATRNPRLTIRCTPFIVPPLLDKVPLLKHRTLRTIWNIARETIAEADELVFIGYSWPATDFMTEFLFRQARKSRSQQVTVVAPDATQNLLPRYTDVFGPIVRPIDKDFHGWLLDSGVIDLQTLRPT